MKPASSSRSGKFLAAVLVVAAWSGDFAARSQSPQAEEPHSFLQIFSRQFPLGHPEIPAPVVKALRHPIRKGARDSGGRSWQATAQGLMEMGPRGAKKLWTGKDGLPILGLRGLAAGPDGRLWMATLAGAITFQPDAAPGNRWHYFWGRRFLPDNSVEAMVAEQGRAWIRTRTGISLIEFKPFTLAEKSALFLDRLRRRHLRYGFVAECEMPRAGDPASCRPVPSDNDGLWTSLYVAAESFRFAATRSPDALRNARESLAALVRLEAITGIPGFPARALIHEGDFRPAEGEWHETPDGEWEWKGDTSSDELVGHFFAHYVAYELLPEEADRAAIRPVVRRIAQHLLDHDLNLVGFGGRVTHWGRYSPQYFETPDGKVDRALNSLELLSHLRVAYQVTGDQKFIQAYHRLVEQRGYLQNVMGFAQEAPAEVNYSDEELAFLSFYPLMQLEDDPRLRASYREALEGLWRRGRAEHNPLWNFIHAAGAGAAADPALEDSVETLERIPMDTISWTVRNSQRADLERDMSHGRFGEAQSRSAIPPNERRVMKWNGNPFELDGGDEGRTEDDGTFFLLPYWLGRYQRLISP